MKRNDLAEIKKMDLTSLRGRVKKEQQELTGLSLDKSVSKLAHLKVIKNKRKDLAQILTVLQQKVLLEKLEKEEKNGTR